MKTYTPYQFAKDECANLHDGTCLTDGEDCRLKFALPCDYFDQSILPLADQRTRDRKLQPRRKQARRDYELAHGREPTDPEPNPQNTCPDCDEPIAPRQRYCPRCRLRRRRQSTREAVARNRHKRQQP